MAKAVASRDKAPKAATTAEKAASPTSAQQPKAAAAAEAKQSPPWLGLAVLLLGVVLVALQDPAELQLKVDMLLGRATAPATSRGVDCRDALPHLTDVMPVKGFHVLCIETTPLTTLSITAFKDGMTANRTGESAIDLMAFRLKVEELVDLFRPDDAQAIKYKQPYAFFTPDGERLETKLSTLVNRVVFLFEGGQFIWPGIKVGHKRIVKDVYGKGDVEMETLSMTPLVFAIEEFLKDEEIDIIMELSLPYLAPSGVTHNDGDENRPATDWRTSTTYFLPSSAHEMVQSIDRRTADLVKVPKTHQEFVQVLRYEKTQKYDHHLDIFSAERHQNNPELLETIEYGHKNRMITVFWYMSDVAKGGHTIFPRAGGLPPPKSMKDCTVGLKVPPKKRKVIVFYSMLPNGVADPMSLHGGCPVEDGIKYSGNKWVWNKPRGDVV